MGSYLNRVLCSCVVVQQLQTYVDLIGVIYVRSYGMYVKATLSSTDVQWNLYNAETLCNGKMVLIIGMPTLLGLCMRMV